jgi:hypothetical protein
VRYSPAGGRTGTDPRVAEVTAHLLARAEWAQDGAKAELALPADALSGLPDDLAGALAPGLKLGAKGKRLSSGAKPTAAENRAALETRLTGLVKKALQDRNGAVPERRPQPVGA